MSDETEYHQRREAVERVRAIVSLDHASRERHVELAELHRAAWEIDPDHTGGAQGTA